MSITYPLAIPGAIGPAQANLKKFDAVAETISLTSGVSEQAAWPDQHWELDLAWPQITWAQFAALDAFAGALHGKYGSFLWGPPWATAPRGSGGGTPTVVAYTPPSVITYLTIESIGGGYTALLVNVDNLHGLGVGESIVLSGITHKPEFNGLPLMISGTGSNAQGPFFLFAPYAHSIFSFEADTGSVTLSPAGSAPGSNYLSTTGWPANQAGVLLPGDFLQITANDLNGISRQRLYQYIGASPVPTDSSGNATFAIFPAIREAPPGGTAIVIANPAGTFRLAENLREAPAEKTKTFTFAMKCREAI